MNRVCSSFLKIIMFGIFQFMFPAVSVPGLRLRGFPGPHRRALARSARQPACVPVPALPLQFGVGSLHPDAPGPPAQRTEPGQFAVARESRAGGGDQIPIDAEEPRREQGRNAVSRQRNRRRRRQTVLMSLLSVRHRSEGPIHAARDHS